MARSRRLHEFLKVLLSPILLRVRSGPLKGKRWIASSGSRFLSGRYEPETTATISDNVVTGDVVYDVGAHVGYFAVLMSQLAGESGRVFAFEPRPLNLHFLKRHVAVNNCTNIEVIPLCVGECSGPVLLETRTGTGTGHISDTGDTAVQMVSLDELVEAGTLPPPTFLKIDVEGGEMGVLQGARRTIDRYRPRMVLSTHGKELDRKCSEFLHGMGYQLTDVALGKEDAEYLALPRL